MAGPSCPKSIHRNPSHPGWGLSFGEEALNVRPIRRLIILFSTMFAHLSREILNESDQLSSFVVFFDYHPLWVGLSYLTEHTSHGRCLRVR
jgi:hypothetical protein